MVIDRPATICRQYSGENPKAIVNARRGVGGLFGRADVNPRMAWIAPRARHYLRLIRRFLKAGSFLCNARPLAKAILAALPTCPILPTSFWHSKARERESSSLPAAAIQNHFRGPTFRIAPNGMALIASESGTPASPSSNNESRHHAEDFD